MTRFRGVTVEVVYEPEIHTFGGADAMGLAHALFHADSRHLLAHLAQRRQDHRRELGLLLGTRLMRAAGQDWYEQGDIWARVAAHRAAEHSPEPSPTTVSAVRRLVTATADTDDSPLGSAPAWPAGTRQRRGRPSTAVGRRNPLRRATLAYLAMRERSDDTSELGVIAHGPAPYHCPGQRPATALEPETTHPAHHHRPPHRHTRYPAPVHTPHHPVTHPADHHLVTRT
ncbi:MAG: thiopeptide-type bacteriocin biosynthesis protein [Pseudonocardiaceae bacterium]